MKVNFLSEQFKAGTFAMKKVGTKEQLGDPFTKPLPAAMFNIFRDWMGLKQAIKGFDREKDIEEEGSAMNKVKRNKTSLTLTDLHNEYHWYV